jgi:hypothetical protein
MRLFGIILLFLLFIGCNKEKQKAPEAFLIQPGSINLAITDPTVQGTASHKITDIWYYVNGKFKGAFPVSSKFPVASTGPTALAFFPGIKNNGISATRQPYEFYAAIYMDTSVAPTTLVNRNFTFSYKTDTKFRWLENFEGFGTVSGISIQNSNNTDTSFTILNKLTDPNAVVYEGNKGMYFAVDNNKRTAQFQSVFQYALPKAGQPVYLEMNYKCTAGFEVGVYAGTQFWYVAGINASPEWNKIYIQLSSGVSNLPGDCGWYVRTIKLDQSTSKEEFWIDNLKILSY